MKRLKVGRTSNSFSLSVSQTMTDGAVCEHFVDRFDASFIPNFFKPTFDHSLVCCQRIVSHEFSFMDRIG
jgi:hypothetical protein